MQARVYLEFCALRRWWGDGGRWLSGDHLTAVAKEGIDRHLDVLTSLRNANFNLRVGMA
jgi:hypothetical protein